MFNLVLVSVVSSLLISGSYGLAGFSAGICNQAVSAATIEGAFSQALDTYKQLATALGTTCNIGDISSGATAYATCVNTNCIDTVNTLSIAALNAAAGGSAPARAYYCNTDVVTTVLKQALCICPLLNSLKSVTTSFIGCLPDSIQTQVNNAIGGSLDTAFDNAANQYFSLIGQAIAQFCAAAANVTQNMNCNGAISVRLPRYYVRFTLSFSSIPANTNQTRFAIDVRAAVATRLQVYVAQVTITFSSFTAGSRRRLTATASASVETNDQTTSDAIKTDAESGTFETQMASDLGSTYSGISVMESGAASTQEDFTATEGSSDANGIFHFSVVAIVVAALVVLLQ